MRQIGLIALVLLVAACTVNYTEQHSERRTVRDDRSATVERQQPHREPEQRPIRQTRPEPEPEPALQPQPEPRSRPQPQLEPRRADSPVSYRVSADPDFKWTGFMASIWYPDLDQCGDALISAGAIGDRITALSLQRAVKEEFKRKSNWPTDSIADAGMTAMIYYNISEDRPEPPRITPIVLETIEEERVNVSVSKSAGASFVSSGGWQAVYSESGVEVEIVRTRRETRTEYPEFRMREPLQGYHVNIAIEVYYLTGEGRRKQIGAPAMCGMAYFHAARLPDDDRLTQLSRTLVERMHGDGWRQSSKPRADETRLKVAYRAAADGDFRWNGHMASVYFPDYMQFGEELTELGAISDRIIGMNLQRAAQEQFRSDSHWRAETIEDAGLLAMIYYTVEKNAPAPPRIVPVEIVVTDEEKIELRANRSYESTNVSHAGWQHMFEETGVKVTSEKRTTTTERREEVVYTCGEDQPEGFHVSIAIEVYYLTGDGRRKRQGKSAQLGMAYWFSPRYPSDGKLAETTQELIKRMHKEAWK